MIGHSCGAMHQKTDAFQQNFFIILRCDLPSIRFMISTSFRSPCIHIASATADVPIHPPAFSNGPGIS
jgi:hypothetical protein